MDVPPAVVRSDAGQTQRAIRHLTQAELALRWRISPRSLERWRWRKVGVPYVKISGRVIYRLADILAYEAAQLRVPGGSVDPFFRKGR